MDRNLKIRHYGPVCDVSETGLNSVKFNRKTKDVFILANFLMTKVSTPIDKHAEDDRSEEDMTFMEHLS